MERARHETLGGQRRTPVTARQAGAAQVQLTGDTARHRQQFGVEDVGAQVGDRPADRHAVGAFIDTGPVGDVDGRFGRAIQVVQAGLGSLANTCCCASSPALRRCRRCA
jgi:hypothetical protein